MGGGRGRDCTVLPCVLGDDKFVYMCCMLNYQKGGAAEPGFVVTIVFKAIFSKEKTYHFLLPENTSNLLKVGRDVQQKGKLGSYL